MAIALHRIWAFHDGPLVGMFIGKPEYGTNVAEYVRADIAQEIAREWTEEMCLAFAEAYDREDAAQRGEPNPWDLDDPGDIGDSEAWQSERIACVRAGIEAVKKSLTTGRPATPEDTQ